MAMTRFWTVELSQFLTEMPYTMKSSTMPGEAGNGRRLSVAQKSLYALSPLRSLVREDVRLESERMCMRPRTSRLAAVRRASSRLSMSP